MRTILTAILALLPLSLQAADAIIHADTPGQTLYVRIRTAATTSVAVAMTEGTSNGVGYYVVTDSSLVSASMPAADAIYPYKVFIGTPSTSAADVQVGVGTLRWKSTAVVDPLPIAAPGASGGLLFAGSNAATTFATLTSTGAFAVGSETIGGTSNVAQTGDSYTRFISLGLDHLISASVTGTDIADNSIIARMASKSATADWDSFNNTTDSMEGLRDAISASAPSAADVADAVWDEATSGHTTSGTFGEQLKTDVDDILTDTSTTLDDLVDDLESRLTGVRAGYLDNLNGHVPQTGDSYARIGAPAGASISADLAAIENQTDDIGIAGAGLTNIDLPNQTMDITGALSGSVGSVTGAVGSISGVTFPSNFGSLAINGSGHISRVTLADTLTTYTGNTPQTGDSFARLGAPAGASVSADLAAIVADTNELQTDWANGGRLDLLIDAILADTNELQTDWANGGRLDLILDAAAAAADPWNTAVPGAYGAGTAGNKLGAIFSALPDAGDQIMGEDAVVSGTTQPRVNRRPDPGFTIQVSRRADGTHKATSPIRLTPGGVDNVFVFIDMAPLFGANNNVETVGTPTVSGGSVTASAEGPRDTYACVELDGTATASDERTITVPVTMDTGTTVNVTFDLKVFAQ